MTTTAPGRLWLLASRLLTTIEATFTLAGVPLPDRRVIYGGQDIADDLDSPDTLVPGLLAVGLVRISQGVPGIALAGAMQPPALIFSATFQAEIHRPASGLLQNLILPSDDEVEVDAHTFMLDGQVLLDAFITARVTGLAGTGQPLVLDQIAPLPVQGGSAGTLLTLTCGTSGPLV